VIDFGLGSFKVLRSFWNSVFIIQNLKSKIQNWEAKANGLACDIDNFRHDLSG
jgi:hypothetical protein